MTTLTKDLHACTQPAGDAALRALVARLASGIDGPRNFEVRVARLTANGWEKLQALNPTSPINQDSLGNAKDVTLIGIGGVPHVAWIENDGGHDQVRVARLNASGGWDHLGQTSRPGSPINVSPGRDASGVSEAFINGQLYVTWTESNGKDTQVRVARLGAGEAGWDPVGIALKPAAPVNFDAARSARQPVIASVGGAPTVAWSEYDGAHWQIRVARLNAAGTGWSRLGTALKPAAPINYDQTQDGSNPSLIDVGGTPYVAWLETSSGGAQVHVARLSTGGRGWEDLGRGTSPVNVGAGGATAPSLAQVAGQLWVSWAQDNGTGMRLRVARLSSDLTRWSEIANAGGLNVNASRYASPPSLTTMFDSVPYVAWAENDGTNREARVARLEPVVTTQNSATDANQNINIASTLVTYGLPYKVGFLLSGASTLQTAPQQVATDPASVTASVPGLVPGGSYNVQTYTMMGAGLLTANAPSAVQVAAITTLRFRTVSTAGMRLGARKAISFTSTMPGVAHVTVYRGRKKQSVVGRQVFAIPMAMTARTFRLRSPHRVGVYRVRVVVTAAGGRRAQAFFKLVVKRALPR